jgi:tetratricopeptide (TPR) repeat protein
MGPYRLIQPIASGPATRIHLAWHEALQRPVALKLILEFTEREEQRFRREVKIAAGLRHPHILPILDFGSLVGEMFRLLYLATDYVDGHTLDLTPLDLRRKLGIVADIADALHYAHREGVIHRDVKPSNILVDRTGFGRIADFGLAKSIDEPESRLTMTGSILGTPHFMSPEQARGEGSIGTASDLFSLGATLYQVATGRLPFEGERSPLLTIRRMATEPPPQPSKVEPGIDPRLERIIVTAMDPDPARRFETAGRMATELRALLRGAPGAGRPPTRRRRVASSPDQNAQEIGAILDPVETQLVLHEHGRQELDANSAARLDAAIDEALRLQPGSAQALLARGRLRLVEDRPEAAASEFARAVDAAPEASAGFAWRARAHLRLYQKSRGIPPIYFLDGSVIVQAYEPENDEQRVLRDRIGNDLRTVERLAGPSGSDARQLLLGGALDLYEGRYAQGEEKLARAVERIPFDGDAWATFGLARLLRADFAGALEALRTANRIRGAPLWLRLTSVSSVALAIRTRAAGESGLELLEESAAAAEEALRLDPDDLRLWRTRATSLTEYTVAKAAAGLVSPADFARLRGVGEELVRKSGNRTPAREVYAAILLTCARRAASAPAEKLALAAQAAEISRESLRLNPTYTESAVNLASTAFFVDDQSGGAPDLLREALAALDGALQLDPREAEFYLSRAEALSRLGRRDEARTAAQTAERLRPDLRARTTRFLET